VVVGAQVEITRPPLPFEAGEGAALVVQKRTSPSACVWGDRGDGGGGRYLG
jgi:hypothetical protein